VPAGTYHFVLDCIVTASVDVTFELIWRHDTSDRTLATWTQHFDPLPAGVYDAQAYEVDQSAIQIDVGSIDELVFRYSAANTSKVEAWIPNGDGSKAHGRIPNITLPD
jgi:hypothetical protein